MIWIHVVILFACIFIGTRMNGIGLGVMGAVGVGIFTFLFGMAPSDPPIAVMLTILSVVVAAGTLQLSGGLDYLVFLAERLLRKHPKRITFVAPFVTWLFTVAAGTQHVCYSVQPVIAEVARETGIRPERPLSVAVISSMLGITASPLSPGTLAIFALLSPLGITLFDILAISIPATFIGSMVAALVVSRKGKELADDSAYQERIAKEPIASVDLKAYTPNASAVISVVLFLFSAISVVLLGSFEKLRPSWEMIVDGETITTILDMTTTIQIVMLTFAAMMILICKPKVPDIVGGSVFKAGATAVVAIFGVVWMSDTVIQAHSETINAAMSDLVTNAPILFAVALFFLSAILYSQAAAVRAIMPLGLALGLSPVMLIGMFPAVNGYFFVPNYPTLVSAVNFDRTGTTRIGKYLFNHSFMIPGLVGLWVAVGVGLLLSNIFL